MNHIDLKNKTVFVTGSAGFIGSNLVLELLRTQSPIHIIGLDNMNDYYDVNIKEWRLKEIEKCVAEHNDSTYVFYKDDLANKAIMAYFGFTNKLLKGETIQIFNYGNCKRDFTYVDDIVEGVKRVMQGAPEKKNGEDGLPIPPYAVYNIGNSNPENLLDFVTILQEELIRAEVLPADYDFEAHKELVAMQPGDVPVTFADTSALERDYGCGLIHFSFSLIPLLPLIFLQRVFLPASVLYTQSLYPHPAHARRDGSDSLLSYRSLPVIPCRGRRFLRLQRLFLRKVRGLRLLEWS